MNQPMNEQINEQNSKRLAYLNGEFLSMNKAHISPLDRGFLLGDGIYEVIPVYYRKLFH